MNSTPASRAEFSLAAGGPTHRLQQRLGLITPESPHLARRAALSLLLTCVPLLVLPAAQGLAIGHHVRIPFLSDFAAYACFLVAIPLLILAEGQIEPRIAGAAAHFIHSRLVPERQYPAYEAAVDRALRLCDATLAEVVLLGLAGVSVVVARHEFPLHVSTWLSLVSDSVHIRTWAGWWYLVMGVALFQFLLWRWLWRLGIWYGFLWCTSRLDLQLIRTHPDRAAGLGFVGDAQCFFWIILVALSATTAGVLGNEIVFGRGSPHQLYDRDRWVCRGGAAGRSGASPYLYAADDTGHNQERARLWHLRGHAHPDVRWEVGTRRLSHE